VVGYRVDPLLALAGGEDEATARITAVEAGEEGGRRKVEHRIVALEQGQPSVLVEELALGGRIERVVDGAEPEALQREQEAARPRSAEADSEDPPGACRRMRTCALHSMAILFAPGRS
jgi:hypothetical protein